MMFWTVVIISLFLYCIAVEIYKESKKILDTLEEIEREEDQPSS